mmetsp:Transcript_129813/g.225615  ORF Transcript_129813/g.225615 Transcript_129813/m.225615 type:complete len:438 (-) Transcript_129813:127-1440(-)
MIYVFLFSCAFDFLSAELDTLCAATGSGCDIEDASAHLDTSLLQLALHLSSEAAGPDQVREMGSQLVDNATPDLPRNHAALQSDAAVLKAAHRDAGKDRQAQATSEQDGVFHASSLLALTTRQLSQAIQELTSSLGTFMKSKGVAMTLSILILCSIFVLVCMALMERVQDEGPLDSSVDSVFKQSATAPAAASLLQGSAKRDETVAAKQKGNSASSAESYTADEVRQKPGTPPPPICPSLVLPKMEAKFVIALSSLKRPTGVVNILGNSGRMLLKALISQTPDGRRCLALSSSGNEDDPRTIVLSPPTQGAASSSTPSGTGQDLELFGKLDGFYGHIESRPGGISSILHHGSSQNPVMYLELGSQQDLHMTATTETGNLLASAGRSSVMTTAPGAAQQPISKDVWSLLVQPGTDPVLIASCMLALIFLKPWYQDDPN